MKRELKRMYFAAFFVLVISIIGCTGPITHTTLGEGVPSAKMHFELLTSDYSGGGHLGVSADATCKKSISISDYTRISDFRRGHAFRSDVDNIDASIPAGKEVQLFARAIAGRPSIKEAVKNDCRVIFTPSVGGNYFVTFAYNLPGCELRVYKVGDGGAKEPVEVRECN